MIDGHSERQRSKEQCFAGLNLSSAFQGAGERHFIGGFQGATDGQPQRDAADGNAERLEQINQVVYRRFTFHIGTQRQDDFRRLVA